MFKFILTLTSCFSLSYISFAQLQPPTIQWQKALGGNFNDAAASMKQTSDGGYIIVGSSASTDGDVSGSHGGLDIWVVKLSSTGTIQWQKTFGGSNDDIAAAIRQTSDGGYILAGSTNSTDGNITTALGFSDFWLLRLTSTGTLSWQKSMGNADNEYAQDVVQAPDGGFIVVGNTYPQTGIGAGTSDIMLAKVSSIGNFVWQSSSPRAGNDYVNAVQITANGGFVIAGTTNTVFNQYYHGNYDFLVLTYNSVGTLQYGTVYGGAGNDAANAIQVTQDGSYIAVGSTTSNNDDVTGVKGGTDFWVVKFYTSGYIEWQKTLGGTGNEYANAVQQTSDGGYIVSGKTASNDGDVTGNHGGDDFWAAKLTSTGAIQWKKTFGGASTDYPCSIVQTSDNGYTIAGTTSSNDGDISGKHAFQDIWIAKLSSAIIPIELLSFTGKNTEGGNILNWQTVTENQNDYFDIEYSMDGIFFERIGTHKATGNSRTVQHYEWIDTKQTSTIAYYRLKQVDFDKKCTYSNIISLKNKPIQPIVQIHPNPSSDFIVIDIENHNQLFVLYNAFGKVVYQAHAIPEKFDLSNLATGLYFAHINQQILKFIKK